MGDLLHIADRLIGRPLLISPHKAEMILDVLEGRLRLDVSGPQALRAPSIGRNASVASSLMVRDGVAHIVIDGSLVNRGAWIGTNSGLVSYEGLYSLVAAADADKSVKGVVLDINSAGGEVGGLFALCDQIRAVAKRKPVVAVVNDMAASAAYAIASQAGRIVVSPSSSVGSIGVVLLHLDRSEQMAKSGLRPTLIHAGAHKVDGNPFTALPQDVRARMQADVDQLYGLLLDTVARGRGNRLSKAAAKATQARMFIGRDAVAAGLADEIATFDQVMKALAEGSKPAAPAAPAAIRTEAPPAPTAGEAVNRAMAMAAAHGPVDPRLQPQMAQLALSHPSLRSQPGKLLASAEAVIQAADEKEKAKVRDGWAKAIARVNG